MAFGLVVAWAAALGRRDLRRWAVVVIAADAAWIVASVVALLLAPLTVAGAVTVAVLACLVGTVAAWQLAGLARSPRGPAAHALVDVEVVEGTYPVPVAPDTLWPIITDHGRYGRLAPTLRSVEVISDPGEALRRRCTNTRGQAWEESCTLWDAGRRYAVTVDTTGRYPYPLDSLTGVFQVDPDPAGSAVTVRFDARRLGPTARSRQGPASSTPWGSW